MKKISIFTFLLLTLGTSGLFAQSPAPRIGVFLEAGYADFSLVPEEPRKDRGFLSYGRGGMSFSAGGSISWMPGKVGFRTGLTLHQHQVRFSEMEYAWIYPGPQDPSLPLSLRSSTNTLHLELPLEAAFQLASKIRLHAGAGVQFRFWRQSRIVDTFPSGKEVSVQSEGISTLNLPFLMGLEYALNDRFALEARFRMNLLPEEAFLSNDARLWSTHLRFNWNLNP